MCCVFLLQLISRCLNLSLEQTNFPSSFVGLIFSSFQEWANAMSRRTSSVRPSVNFCANRFFSQTNGRIATKLVHDGLQVSVHPGMLKVKFKVKGHVICALSWILRMSYSVIDGLVIVTPSSLLSLYVTLSFFYLHLITHYSFSFSFTTRNLLVSQIP